MLFQLAEIYACRNFEGNKNVFVRGSRDLPLKTMLISTCIGFLVTGDIRPVTLMFDEGLMLYEEIRCWSLSKIKWCRK